MEEQKVCNQIYKVQINHRKNHKSKSKKHIPLGDWRNKELRNNIRPTEAMNQQREESPTEAGRVEAKAETPWRLTAVAKA